MIGEGGERRRRGAGAQGEKIDCFLLVFIDHVGVAYMADHKRYI
jgi:hypothetical protein